MQNDMECPHATLLRTIHGQFLEFGLTLCSIAEESVQTIRPTGECNQPDGVRGSANSHQILFTQSATGAFTPLRYTDGERVITVHALAIFDNLIVNAMAITSSTAALHAKETRSDIIRRVTFDVSRWLQPGTPDSHQRIAVESDDSSRMQNARSVRVANARTGAGQQSVETQCEEAYHYENQIIDDGAKQDVAEIDCEYGTPAAVTSTQRNDSAIPPELREDFRAAVLSGLLLHLCPAPGQFADLFGLEESLRERVLRMLGAKDLATFGLTSRAGADSALSDSLWAPLVAAEFTDQEQHAMLFSRPPEDGAQSNSADRTDKSSKAGDGELDNASAASKQGRRKKGASRCLYAKLHSARVRRAAIAAEQRRRMTIFEMGALGRLGRTWGLYPWAPYLPRGPYHVAGPAGSDFGWGPASVGGTGVVSPEESLGAGPGVPPHPMWGVGWGRRAGSWRTYGPAGGGGSIGGVGCSVFGDTGGGIGGSVMGVPPPSYSQAARRSRARFLGEVPGM